MLTTRCPSCGTTFRIRPEQLGVRGGRVRCGSCHTAFSALSSLEEIPDDEPLGAPARVAPRPAPEKPAEQVEPAPVADHGAPAEHSLEDETISPPPVPAAPLEAPTPERAEDKPKEAHPDPAWLQVDTKLPLGGFLHRVDTSPLPKASEPEPLPMIPDAPPLINPDRLVEPRFPDSIKPIRADAPEDQGLKIEIDMGAGKPASEPAKPAVPEKPYRSQIAQELGVLPFDADKSDDHGLTYMLSDSLDERPPVPIMLGGDETRYEAGGIEPDAPPPPAREVEDRRRKRSGWPWALASIPLCLLALALLAYLFRTEVARNLPQARPYLEQACAELACTVPYPHEPDQIKVEGSNLYAESAQDGRSRLVVTLRNKAAFPVEWPSIELTLTDKFDVAIARRVLKPAEWLPADQAKAPAFAAHTEVTANVLIQSKQEPSGFRVYAFYP